MITNIAKATAQAIVNIFETGSPHGKYGMVTLMAGDSGQLTYGRSQTTLTSGNLFLLLKDYCQSNGAHSAQLAPYLDALEMRSPALNGDAEFHRLLRTAGDDPVMRNCQDEFFDRVYWQPAEISAGKVGLVEPLSVAVVYDSVVHGSWARIRDRTLQTVGPAAGQEREWTAAYVDTRRTWLATHSNPLLGKTVYRMDTFRQLIASGAWSLTLPLTVRGIRLDAGIFQAPVRVSAQEVEERLLRLVTPYMRGGDISDVQAALSKAGIPCAIDGIFGPATAQAVQAFQRKQDMVADGIVGPATRARLGR